MTESSPRERWWSAAQDDTVHVAAADWLTRLQDADLSLEDSLQWQRWIEADPRHARAFARLESIWSQPWSLMGTQRRKSSRKPAWLLAASVAVAVAAAAWTLQALRPGSSRDAPIEIVRTMVGENRTVLLSDGSQVVLGGSTELGVTLSSGHRRMELIHGEAFFTVARDPARPFSVDAGTATVTALGTEFNVRRGDDRTIVAVVEGQVMVAPASLPRPLAWLRGESAQRHPARLIAGQQATVSEAGLESTRHMEDPGTITAWRNGRLIFRDEPLRQAVEDVNRYAAKPIVIAEDAIGDLQISGTVLNGNVQDWLQTLESAFALRAREEPQRIVLEHVEH